jgi:hypothetical protein
VKADVMAQWNALTAALRHDRVTFTWPELDRLVGGLPASATNHRAWWSGDRPHVRVWRAAGYALDGLDPGRSVTFVRISQPTLADAGPGAGADLVLVACAKTKLSVPAQARDLYISPTFAKSRAYAEAQNVPWFILSAEFGLLSPDQLVAPYDRYLPDMSPGYRAAWGRWTVERLALLAGALDGRVVEVHAGAPYVDAIAPHLAAKGARLVDRLKGLRQGERQAWYGSRPADTPALEFKTFADQLVAAETGRSPAQFLATDGAGLRVPGLYSWWADQPGAADLSRGLQQPVSPGLI